MQFEDRRDAGRFLAEKLRGYAYREDVVILALPRGGVPVAAEIAAALHVPLDVFIVRKLGVPGHEELAMGAIGPGGTRVLNESIIRRLRIRPEVIETVALREQEELDRREREYRDGREPIELRGRTAILVDDGLATGASMRAAVATLRKSHPAKIVVAVPVGAGDTCQELEKEADEVVCGLVPEHFEAVGAWYEDFTQTTDREVADLLHLPR